MERFVLTDSEVAVLEAVGAELAARFHSTEAPGFLEEAAVLAHELPRRLRAAVTRFKLEEPHPALLLLSGLRVDQRRCGPTPAHWQVPPGHRPPALDLDIQFILIGSLLGQCIAWSSEQEGRVLQNIMPVRGLEQEQIGLGCEQEITWHTEDAAKSHPCDFLGLFSVRNHDRVPTTVATVDGLALDPADRDLLFEPHFIIQPDLAHGQELARRGLPFRPEKLAVLAGDRAAPYIRIDPYFMPKPDHPRAQSALEALIEAIDARLEDVVLDEGDVCFLDNMRCVHGRRAFKARHDGTDRWLKRINVACDLRKSRAVRGAATARVLG